MVPIPKASRGPGSCQETSDLYGYIQTSFMNSTTQEFNSSCNLVHSAKPEKAGQQREMSDHKCSSKDREEVLFYWGEKHTTDSNTQMSLGPTTSGISQRSPHLKVPATPWLGDSRAREEWPQHLCSSQCHWSDATTPTAGGRPPWAGQGRVGRGYRRSAQCPAGQAG